MTGIIANAQKLLDGATPGPWIAADSDIISPDNVFIGTVSEYSGLIDGSEEQFNTQLAAAAPELAQALAEETWEYQVEEKWLTNDGPVWRAAGNRWHLSMSAAQSDAVQYCQTRIVRRRVSPPEVIND